ncbi:hypothetical protein ACFL17_02850 [Pseudomonadota bacterium]
MIKRLFFGVGTIILSLLVSLVIAELVLRFAYPRYEYAADADYLESALRIWKRRPYEHKERGHPDTGRPHEVTHNNLALRHNRDISDNDLRQRINIGVFGDSFTENVRLPAAHGFVEIVDYLLNLRSDKFNVLNFGVDGYGPDQHYLYYREWSRSHKLDHVIYILCSNDLGNLYDNKLFSLDSSGRLVRNSVTSTPFWTRFASQLHVTYLIIDAKLRLTGTRGSAVERFVRAQNDSMRVDQEIRKNESDPRLLHKLVSNPKAMRLETPERELMKQSFALFGAVLDAWRREVELAGGSFSVVLLPREGEHRFAGLLDGGYRTLDLYSVFRDLLPGYQFETIRFTNDGHWNEQGNLLAGSTIFRFLERELGLGKLADEEVRKALHLYYQAVGDGWFPDKRWTLESPVEEAKSVGIRRRYVE